MGNSTVRQSINQPEPRFTGTIATSKLDAKLAQQFGSDFNATTDKQISNIANQTATNLTDTVELPETNFADITTFANSDAGVNLALSSVAHKNQLFGRLGEQAISVRNAQSRIGATAAQNTIRAAREIDPIAAAAALAKPTVTRDPVTGSTTLFKTSLEVGTGKNKQGKTIPKAGFKGQVGFSGAASGLSSAPLRIIASAVIGGTVSKITGGKFANGAVSAAFAASIAEAGNKAFNSREGEHEPVLADLTDEQKADINSRLAVINEKAGTRVGDDGLGVAKWLDNATASLREDYVIEFGANILSVDGGAGFTAVTTEFYTNAIGIPYIEGALARWHNHPGGTSVSGADFMNAAYLGIDSYVSVGGGSIHRFNYSMLSNAQNAAAATFFGQGYNTLDKLQPKLNRWLEEQSAFHRNKYISVY